jgi:glycosyltransferase involved in cell wall biosynthesis
MPKLLIINQFCGNLCKDIANAYAQRGGWQVELFTGWVEPEGSPLRQGIHVHQGIRYDRSTALRRLRTWGQFTWQLYRYLRRQPADTRVLYVSNPPFAPLLAPAFRHRYAILVYDLYPDVLVNHGMLRADGLFARRWARRNLRSFEGADIVFTLSDNMKTALRPYFFSEKTWAKKSVVIPNWADTNLIKPIPKLENKFLKANDLLEKFVVLYSGNMGVTHPLETLLNVAERLRQQRDIVFVFIGDGAKRPDLERRAQAQQLDNVRFLPYQPFDQLSHSLSAADLNVIALDKAAASASVPSKTYYALAAGCALLAITEPTSEVSQLIEEHQLGAHFTQEQAADIARYIQTAQADPARLAATRQRAAQAAQQFTPRNAAYYADHWPHA